MTQPQGNYFNKYTSGNPVYRKLMTNFFSSLEKCLREIEFQRVYEAGCGEGYVTAHIAQSRFDIEIHASDISTEVVKQAKMLCPNVNFSVGSVYQIDFPTDSFDLVVACEVLEHLETPETAIQELLRVTKRYLLLSVPNEPVWRICNVLRGKYFSDLGNTPGHIQHWSTTAFRSLVEQSCDILKQEVPFPWTMLLCEKRKL